MAETTQNYQLTCPDKTDYYNVEVENENMKKIDAALAECINVGGYIGDGETTRKITLPRTPKFVLVLKDGSMLREQSQTYSQGGGLAIAGHPATFGQEYLEIVDGGFEITHLPNGTADSKLIRLVMNTTGAHYSYIWG